MQVVALFAAFAGTLISILSLSRIAYAWHDKSQPRTLSELAAEQDTVLLRFRNTLWLCGTLFAVTVYGLLIWKLSVGIWLFVAWTVTYVGNILLAVFPARDKTVRLHLLYAQAMAAGMLAMAYLFWVSMQHGFEIAGMVIALSMTTLALLTVFDKVRYIFYELSFLYLSHASIALAAVYVTTR